MAITATPAVTSAINAARSLPGLIANLSAISPAFAKQLIAKPLLAAKSPPVVFLAGALAWASGRYGLDWDADTCSLVAGGIVLVAGYAMRAVTKQPIAGIVAVPADTPPAAPGTAPVA